MRRGRMRRRRSLRRRKMKRGRMRRRRRRKEEVVNTHVLLLIYILFKFQLLSRKKHCISATETKHLVPV